MKEFGDLARRLAASRDEGAAFQPFFDDAVDSLHALEIGNAAPAVGSEFPDFMLPNANGEYRRLSDLTAGGPVVLSFSRGLWCPYCSHELAVWHAALDDLAAAGGRLVAVTGEIGGAAKVINNTLSDAVEVLCDVNHGVALSLGLAFFAGEPMLDFYEEHGLDFHSLYGSEAGFLPVPATFVIDSTMRVRFAFVEVDFRLRAEPGDVIEQVRALAR